MRHDCAALEGIEFDASVDLYRAAPEEVRVAHSIEAQEVGSAKCLVCRGIGPAAVFRRIAGLGVGRATNETELDEALAFMDGRRLVYAVPVGSQAQPATLASWLEQRGFARGYAWMKFCGPCNPAAQAESDLEIRVVDHGLGGEFGQVVSEGFGLPSTIAPWVGTLAGRTNWICVMAFSGSAAQRAPLT
jgi:hypothetical protein